MEGDLIATTTPDPAETLAHLADKLESGKGTIAQLLNDPALYNDLRVAVKESRELIRTADSSISGLRADAKQTLGKVDESLSVVREEVAGVKELVSSGKEAVNAVRLDAEAFKGMPVVRSYVEDAAKILIRPNCSKETVYYVEEDLFEPGRAVLTGGGRDRLDKVAAWLNSQKQKHSEVVVAGFADAKDHSRTAAEHRILSKQQCETVVEYLKGKGVHKMGTFTSNRNVTPIGLGTDPSPVTEVSKVPAQRTEITLFVPQ